MSASGTAFNGALGGVFGGDEACQIAASHSPFPITHKKFKAWLSDSMSSPQSRFTKDGAFVRFDGVKVATSWEQLTSAGMMTTMPSSLSAPIILDEYGMVRDTQVWTGTGPDGHPAPYTCSGWTDAGEASVSYYGLSSATFFIDWTVISTDACSTQKALYCVEQ